MRSARWQDREASDLLSFLVLMLAIGVLAVVLAP